MPSKALDCGNELVWAWGAEIDGMGCGWVLIGENNGWFDVVRWLLSLNKFMLDPALFIIIIVRSNYNILKEIIKELVLLL